MKIRTEFVVLLLGALIAYSTYALSYNIENSNITAQLESDSHNRFNSIARKLDSMHIILESIQGLFETNSYVSRTDFRSIINHFFVETEAIQALEWIPRVLHEDRARYKQLAINDGFKDFEIKMLVNGDLVKTTEKEEYFPVYYVEPYIGNQQALGFDLGSNPTRYASLDLARKSGEMIATPKISLIQEAGHAYGYLTFLPIYSGSPDYRSLKGFALGVFKINDIIEISLDHLDEKDIDLVLYDITDGFDDFLYYSAENSDAEAESKDRIAKISHSFKTEHTIPVRNRVWKIVLIAGDDYIKSLRTPMPYLLGGMILFISIIIAYYIYLNKNEKLRIQKRVEMKAEELEQSKFQIELAINGANIGIWDWNLVTGYTYFNKKWDYIIENTQGTSVSHINSWINRIHPEDRKKVIDEILAFIRGTKDNYEIEHRILAYNGEIKWLLTKGKVQSYRTNGRPEKITGIFIDITELKRTQEKFETLSITDPLTSVINKRALLAKADEYMARFLREGRNYSLAMVDIDHFKNVNDSYGHQAGDFILKSFAGIIDSAIRDYDTIGRYGGEEFTILFDNSNKGQALAHLKRIKAFVQTQVFEFEGATIEIKFSAGICDAAESVDNSTVNAMIKKADARLYYAKEHGRDQIVIDDH